MRGEPVQDLSDCVSVSIKSSRRLDLPYLRNWSAEWVAAVIEGNSQWGLFFSAEIAVES